MRVATGPHLPLAPDSTKAPRLWLIAVAAVLLYLPTVGYGLVNLDDPWLIARNARVAQPSAAGLVEVFTDLSAQTRYELGSEYLPIRDLSVMLDHVIFGKRYGLFHITNVLLFGLAVWLLGRVLLLWGVSGSIAAWTAVLFAVHPVHAESVAWLSERKGLLCLVLSLAALAQFVRCLERPARLLPFVWLGLLSGAAVWSKGVAVALVPLYLGLALVRRRTLTRAHWLSLAAIVVVIGLCFVPLWISGQRLQMVVAHHGGGVAGTAWLMTQVHGLYLKHLIGFGPFGIYYDLPSGAAVWLTALIGIGGGVIALVLVLRAIRRQSCGALALGSLVWLAFLIPVSQVVFPLQNLIADRYLLLPSAGGCLVIAALTQRVLSPRPQNILLGLFAAVLAVTTVFQSATWRSDRALFEQARATAPSNADVLVALAVLEGQGQRTEQRKALLNQAVKLEPLNSRANVLLALDQAFGGDRDGAIARLKRIAGNADADQACVNLALLLRWRDPVAAMRYARRAVSINPYRGKAHFALGTLLFDQKEFATAAKSFEQAIKRQPGHLDAHYNLALAWIRLQRFAAALQVAEKGIALAPKHTGLAGLVRDLRKDPRARDLQKTPKMK